MNSKKKIGIGVAIVVIVIIFGLGVLSQKQKAQPESSVVSRMDPVEVPPDWKRYENAELGIAFSFPLTARVEEREEDYIYIENRVTLPEVVCDEERSNPGWISIQFKDNPEGLSLETFADWDSGAVNNDDPVVVQQITLDGLPGIIHEQTYYNGNVARMVFVEAYGRVVVIDRWVPDESWETVYPLMLGSVAFSEPAAKHNVHALESLSRDSEDKRLVFYDENSEKTTVIENLNQAAAESLGREGILLRELYFPPRAEELYFYSYIPYSDSPHVGMYAYSVSTRTFRKMRLSDHIKTRPYLSPDKKWVIGYNTRSEKTIGKDEALYVFDLGEDNLIKKVTLDGSLTFMKACAGFADTCFGSEPNWIDDTTFEYDVYESKGLICESDRQLYFPLFERRQLEVGT